MDASPGWGDGFGRGEGAIGGETGLDLATQNTARYTVVIESSSSDSTGLLWIPDKEIIRGGGMTMIAVGSVDSFLSSDGWRAKRAAHL